MINNCIQIPMIDNFFCHYQYTIQVLIAIGTIGSVITSLILARLQYGIKTKGTISIKIFLPKLGYINPGIRIDGKNIKEENLYMVANIVNIGNVKVKIDGNVFYMKIPFLNLAITKLPFTLEHTLHKFPCWIEPGESKTFTAKYDEKNLSFAIPSLENWFYRFLLQISLTGLLQIKIFTYTSNGQVLRLRISKYFNKKLRDIILQKK
jgi:hypothetical protein